MTSEPDSNDGRRPPTIELKATEVPDPAAATDAAAGDAPPPPISDPAEASPQPSGGASRVVSHSLSGIIGAVLTAAVVAGLWFAGIIPQHAPSAPGASVSTANLSTASTEARAPATDQALSDRLAKIEQAIQTQPNRQALTDRITAAEAQTKALRDQLAALSRRLDDIAGTSESAAKQAAAAASAAQAAKTASEAASQASQQNASKTDLDALAHRVAALEETVRGLADAASHPVASASDQAVRLAVAAQALRAAVEGSMPYQAELATVEALGVQQTATAPLQPFAASGVPSPAALAHELAGLVPALQRAVEGPADTTTLLGRLEANARHLVRITPAQAPAGHAPAAVVARIEADASRTDIGAARADIAALPDSAKSIAADWLQKSNARLAAFEASRQIAADALVALSKPASQ